MQIIILRALLALLMTCLFIPVAHADDPANDDLQTLSQVLDGAKYIVRGRLGRTRTEIASGGETYQYIELLVGEVLKGDLSAGLIEVREPNPPSRDEAGGVDGEIARDDLIFLLGPRNNDGSFSAVSGSSDGWYAVEADGNVESVLVNPLGVDADSVSPKDVHRHISNSKVPMAVFRALAKDGHPSTSSTRAVRNGTVSPWSSTPPKVATPLSENDESVQLSTWMAIAAMVVAIVATIAMIFRRYMARLNTSRNKSSPARHNSGPRP